MKRKNPVASVFFDIFGVLFWLTALVCFYGEEIAGAGLDTTGMEGAIAASIAIHRQDALLELACATAIVGTLFLGFSAVLKALARNGGVEGGQVIPSSDN